MNDTEKNSAQEVCSEWSLSQEREFMEELVQKRFNFLLVVLTLVLGGALSAGSTAKLKIILTVGSVILALVSATLFRAYVKLDEVLKVLHQDPRHPIAIIQKRLQDRGFVLFGVQWIVGAFIPGVLTSGLFLVTILVWIGCIRVE
jgi:hypothetical protein